MTLYRVLTNLAFHPIGSQPYMNCEILGKLGVFVSLIVIFVTTPHWKMKPLFQAPQLLVHKPANIFPTLI